MYLGLLFVRILSGLYRDMHYGIFYWRCGIVFSSPHSKTLGLFLFYRSDLIRFISGYNVKVMLIEPLLPVCLLCKFLDISKFVSDILHQFILLKPHYQLVTVPFTRIDKIGFMEIWEISGDILEVFDKIMFYIAWRND
jgi:hypothetical protein